MHQYKTKTLENSLQYIHLTLYEAHESSHQTLELKFLHLEMLILLNPLFYPHQNLLQTIFPLFQHYHATCNPNLNLGGKEKVQTIRLCVYVMDVPAQNDENDSRFVHRIVNNL